MEHDQIVEMVKRVREELKGKQHKIDMNKNGKLDAQDFEHLRKMKEESELDEAMSPQQRMDFDKMLHGAMSRDAYNTKWKKNTKSSSKSRSDTLRKIHGVGQKNEEVELDEEHLDEKNAAEKRGVSYPKPLARDKAGRGDYLHQPEGEAARRHKSLSDGSPGMKKVTQNILKDKIRGRMGRDLHDFDPSTSIHAKKSKLPEEVESVEEGWDDMVKAAKARMDAPTQKTSTKTYHDVKKTSTGTVYTKQFDSEGQSKGSGDDAAKAAEPKEKRGRGRPVGSKSGARQAGSSSKTDYRGFVDHVLNLPANK